MMKIKRTVVMPLLICLLLRLFLFLAVHPWDPSVSEHVILQGDAPDYHNLAITLMDHHTFSLREVARLEELRTPLYPLFIGLVYSMAGEKPWIVLLFQVVIDTLSCLFIYRLLEKVLSSTIAFYASLFYAIDPHLILFSNTLLSETLFVFFCVAGFYFFAMAIQTGFQEYAHKRVLFSALFFGAATLVETQQSLMPRNLWLLSTLTQRVPSLWRQ